MAKKIGTLLDNDVFDGEDGPYIMLEGQPIYLDNNQIRRMTPIESSNVPLPKVDPKRKPYSKAGSPEILDRIGPLGVQGRQMKNSDQPPIVMTEGNLPVIDTSNPNVGFGPKGNIFPGGPLERKALMNAYGGTGSENALKAMAEDRRLMRESASEGVVGPASPLAQGLAELKIAKRDRLKKQMNMRDPSDYYNPPQRQISVGQLLGKGG